MLYKNRYLCTYQKAFMFLKLQELSWTGTDLGNVRFVDAKVVSVDVETCLTNRLTTYNVLFNVWSTPQPATTAARSVSTSLSAECLNQTLDRQSQLWCQHMNFLFHFEQSHFQITFH